jgi:NADPH:quinone reductase-like Zn-dependent oxidoreductase
MRTGKPYFARLFTGFPKPKHRIPGTGFAGTVDKVGEHVTQFKVGEFVFGETTLGFSTNAEYVSISEDGVVLPLPESMNFAEASTYGDGFVTSLNFLQEIGQLQAGQSVLINGASGALGTAAVQIAKHLGAEVTAVSSTRNVNLVTSLGADYVIDYTKTDFTKLNQKFDLVYDTIGKSSFSKAKSILKPNGQYLSPVLKGQLLLDMLCTSIVGSKKARFAATGLRSNEELKNLLQQLVEMQSAGKLKTIIDRQFPLEKTREAHTYVDAGRKRGNVIINI